MHPRLFRLLPFWIVLVLAAGCASGKTGEAEVRVGKIVARESVDLERERSRSRTSTSFGVSVSSGGGVAVGLGFLLSPLFSDRGKPVVRYEIEMLDGQRMIVYHSNSDFASGDCVEVRVYADAEKNPPQLRRNEGAC